jgi:hypothetical protein
MLFMLGRHRAEDNISDIKLLNQRRATGQGSGHQP